MQKATCQKSTPKKKACFWQQTCKKGRTNGLSVRTEVFTTGSPVGTTRYLIRVDLSHGHRPKSAENVL